MLKYNFNAVRRRKGRQWESTVIQVRDGNEIVSDSEEGGNSADDDNEGYTDRTWQPIARAHVTNLKGVSKLDKPAGKCKFTVQAGIIATVKHQNYFLELFVLFITMGLVWCHCKKWKAETSGRGGWRERVQQFHSKRCFWNQSAHTAPRNPCLWRLTTLESCYTKHVPLLKCFYFLDNNSVPPFMNKRLYKVQTVFDDANRK